MICVWPTREESREIAKQPLQPGELVQPRITRSSQESTYARATARENLSAANWAKRTGRATMLIVGKKWMGQLQTRAVQQTRRHLIRKEATTRDKQEETRRRNNLRHLQGRR